MIKNRLIACAKYLFLFSFLSVCISPDLYAFFGHSDREKRRHAEYPNPQAVGESTQPRQIALLLPLTGKHADSAKAIREGFFASFYQQSGQKPIVKVYDTTKEQDVQRVYDLAISEGADFVVGPLSKEDVHRLSLSSLRTPVLALNSHPDVRQTRQFIQYALAPEAEAEQIADKAWQKGYRHAGLIVPDNAWGKRTQTAFTNQWQRHGGRVVRTVYTNPSHDQSAPVRKLLGIDESQQRANHIKNVLGEKVDFQPRRRKDMDVIVMAAPPDQARQLKPLFDFYYAEDLPVYATSSVYTGHPNAKRDRDMNGVIFCDMPWLVDSEQGTHLRQLLSQAENQSDQYNRLFAMGVDAYQISTSFNRLQAGASFTGATGQLSLINNQIQRQLSFAKIVDGVPSRFN
ncbi:MAG: penicillin-binding protein activator [Proteobacteria bacterium]|nr:penicillin-binding protein activator [Pseudomonadota bacterium]